MRRWTPSSDWVQRGGPARHAPARDRPARARARHRCATHVPHLGDGSVGGPEQPDFLNVVAHVRTKLEPLDLLEAVNRVEATLGRTRDVRWGPRTIDIDILLIDDLTIDEPRLTIPHPRMHQRAFVVMPLLELVADPALPDGTRLLDVRLPTSPSARTPPAERPT